MTPKRGQPPKPPEEQRKNKASIRYNDVEMKLLEDAYALSDSPKTLSRWLAEITLEEAQKIIDSHKR